MHNNQNIYLDEDDEKKKSCCSWRICCIGMFVLVVLLTAGSLFLLYEVGFLSLAFAYVEGEIEMCQQDCLKSSLEIQEFIDPSVSPCDNFHDFACGNYIKSPLPIISTTGYTRDDKIANELLNLIVGKPAESDEPAVLMQKHFFKVCNHEEVMDEDKDKTLKKLIKKLGGWPLELGGKWKERTYDDWMNLTMDLKAHNLPFEWFLHFGIERNETNHLKITVPPKCEIGDVPENYRKYISDIVTIWSRHLFLPSEINSIIDLHKMLCSYYSKTSDLSLDPAETLEEIFAKGNWYDFSLNITNGKIGEWNETHIAQNLNGYIRLLDSRLIKTAKRTKANFIIWKLIEHFAPYLSAPIRELHRNYILERGHDYESRFWFCYSQTQANFPLVSEIAFIRKVVNDDVKTDVGEIVENVKTVLKEHFESSEILDNVTKSQFSRKIDEIKVVIGGDDEIFDTELFEQYLQLGNVSTEITNPIELLMQKQEAHWEAAFSLLGQEAGDFSRSEFYHLYTKSEPFYQVEEQTIVLPAGFLYDSMYNLDRGKFLNYATVGYHFARQLMHAFGITLEPQCMKITSEGCMWSTSSWLNFQHRLGLIQDLYEPHMDADLDESAKEEILEEVYADYTATTVAYDAYQKWVEENEEESGLLDIDYTPNQLFWIKLGMYWCVRKPHVPIEIDEEGLQFKSDFRINGPLMNSAQFNGDFECAEKAPMNSEDKITIF